MSVSDHHEHSISGRLERLEDQMHLVFHRLNALAKTVEELEIEEEHDYCCKRHRKNET